MSQEPMATPTAPSVSFRQITRHMLKMQAETNESLQRGLLGAFRKSVRQVPEAFFHYPVLDLPEGAEEKSFHDPDHDVPIHYYVSRAKIQRGVVVACTGLKEPLSLSKERIQDLHDQGLSYICLRLPNSGTDNNILKLYESYQKYFYLDPRSPVHQMFPDTVKIIQAHSTGGQGAIVLATDPATSEDMKQYKAVFADAPFMDTPNSSQHDHPIAQLGFYLYAKLCGDKLPENVTFGALYLILGDIRKGKIKVPENAANKLTFAVEETIRRLDIINKGGEAWEKEIEGEARGLKSHHRLPTFAQMLELRDRPRQHKEFLIKNGVPDYIPITIYADQNDDFSSFKASQSWAELIGATLIESTGIHNQFNKDDAAFAHFLGNMEQYLPAWPEPTLEENIANEAQAEEEKGWHTTLINFSLNAPAQLFARAASLFKWPEKKEEQIAIPTPSALPQISHVDARTPTP